MQKKILSKIKVIQHTDIQYWEIHVPRTVTIVIILKFHSPRHYSITQDYSCHCHCCLVLYGLLLSNASLMVFNYRLSGVAFLSIIVFSNSLNSLNIKAS